MTDIEKVIYWIDNLTQYKKVDGKLYQERKFLWFDLEPKFCAIGTARFIPEALNNDYGCYYLLASLGIKTHEVERLNDIIFEGDTTFKRVQEELKTHPGIYFDWEVAEQIRKHYVIPRNKN